MRSVSVTSTGVVPPIVRRACIPGGNHSTAAYLRASLDHGLVVRDCREVLSELPRPIGPAAPHSEPVDLAVAEIWDLHTWDPTATWAAKNGQPMMIFWKFEKQT